MHDWLCGTERGIADLCRMLGERPMLFERQVQTDVGRADLVAELPQSGRTAVVEVQLGEADADHLGRLVCYCRDLEAEVGVLIAERIGSRIGALCAALNDVTGRRLLLVPLEISGVPGKKGEPLEAILHPPAGDGGAEREDPVFPEAGELLAAGPLIGREGLIPALAGMLRCSDPLLAKAEGLEESIDPLAAALEAGVAKDLLAWPKPGPEGLCSALERILDARAGSLLVACREGSAEAGWILPSLRHALGIDLSACTYRLGPMLNRRRQIDFAQLPIPEAGSGPAGFWRKVAALLPAPEHGRIRTSSRQLSYWLDGGVYLLLVRYEMAADRRRYLVELRIKDGGKASRNDILRRLRAHEEGLRERLPGFELIWRRSSRARDAQLRCRMARRMSPACAIGHAEAVAEAVAAVVRELRPLVREIGSDFRW